MRIQSLEALASVAPLKTKEVPLPGGAVIRVRELSVAQRAEFGAAAREGSDSSALLVEMAAITDEGLPAFPGQREAIAATIEPDTVEAIARAVLILSGLIREGGASGKLTPEQIFTHRLALALGKSVGEMTATMGASEFDDWRRYYAIEPWGATRDNLHAGLIASTLVKLHGNPRRKPPEASDFILRPAADRKAAETVKGLNWFRMVARPKT